MALWIVMYKQQKREDDKSTLTLKPMGRVETLGTNGHKMDLGPSASPSPPLRILYIELFFPSVKKAIFFSLRWIPIFSTVPNTTSDFTAIFLETSLGKMGAVPICKISSQARKKIALATKIAQCERSFKKELTFAVFSVTTFRVPVL